MSHDIPIIQPAPPEEIFADYDEALFAYIAGCSKYAAAIRRMRDYHAGLERTYRAVHDKRWRLARRAVENCVSELERIGANQ